MKSGITINKDGTAAFKAAVEALRKRIVLVGIPAAAVDHPGSEVSNALIGYVQETGSPAKNIPPRPFLTPGVADAKDKIVAAFKKGGKAVLSGDPAAVDRALTESGEAAVAAVRTKILSGPFTPLADSTLKARARRKQGNGRLSQTKSSKDARRELAARAAGAEASTDARPLYDTFSLFNSITYVIKNRKN